MYQCCYKDNFLDDVEDHDTWMYPFSCLIKIRSFSGLDATNYSRVTTQNLTKHLKNRTFFEKHIYNKILYNSIFTTVFLQLQDLQMMCVWLCHVSYYDLVDLKTPLPWGKKTQPVPVTRELLLRTDIPVNARSDQGDTPAWQKEREY